MLRPARGIVTALLAATVVATPVFAQTSGPPYTLTITPPTGGRVQGAGVNCGAGSTLCSVTMPAAMTMGLSAIASAGYTFAGWTGDCSGTTAGLWLALNGPRTCGATFTPVGGTLTTPVITWLTPAPITEGTALGTAQLNATANVAGSFAYTPSFGTVLSAGTHTLSTTFTPADAASYTTASKAVTLVINGVSGLLELHNARLDLASGNVTIEGTFLGVTPVVTLNGAPVTVVAKTDSLLTVAAPSLTAGSYRLVVTDAAVSSLQDSFEWTVGAVGPKGDKGDTGAIGPAGPIGPQGPIGLTGPQGEAGPLGPMGLTGPKGDTGATGAQGPEGAAGPTGLQGPIGLTGPQGPIGLTGPQGPIGLTGAQGPQGEAGTPGSGGIRVLDSRGEDVGPLFLGKYLLLRDSETIVIVRIEPTGVVDEPASESVELFYTTSDCTGRAYIYSAHEPFMEYAQVRGNGAVYGVGEELTRTEWDWEKEGMWSRLFRLGSDLLKDSGDRCEGPSSLRAGPRRASAVLDVSALHQPYSLLIR
jgi:uncharacterized repeat protein (TIGR02543 family)